MVHIRIALALSLSLLLSLTGAVAQAKRQVEAGQYSSIDGMVTLLLARPSGKNWTVRGSISGITSQGSKVTKDVSGTLYSGTGKVALKLVAPRSDQYTLGDIDGTYGGADGAILLRYVNFNGEQTTERCYHSKDLDSLWILEKGYPKTPAITDPNLNVVQIDSYAGNMTFKNYAKLNGEFIDQQFKFYSPNLEYRAGEIMPWFVDGSATNHSAFPYTIAYMRYGYQNRSNQSPYYGTIAIDSSNSKYCNDVGWHPTGKIKIYPGVGANDRFRIVVGIPGDVLEWWYKWTTRLKTSPSRPTKPVAKPDKVSTTTPITPSKPPTSFSTTSVTGDVTYRNTGGGSDYRPLTSGTVLTNRMEVDAALDGSATFRLPNGGTIKLQGGTRLRVEELTANGGQVRSVIRVITGELIYQHLGQSSVVRSDLDIRVADVVASVRGTEFTLKFNEKTGQLSIDLRDGRLEVNPGHGVAPITLLAPTVFTFVSTPKEEYRSKG